MIWRLFAFSLLASWVHAAELTRPSFFSIARAISKSILSIKPMSLLLLPQQTTYEQLLREHQKQIKDLMMCAPKEAEKTPNAEHEQLLELLETPPRPPLPPKKQNAAWGCQPTSRILLIPKEQRIAATVPGMRLAPTPPSSPQSDTLHICCPITQEPIQSPLIAPDGVTYERRAIQEWVLSRIKKHLPVTNPVTGLIFSDAEQSFILKNASEENPNDNFSEPQFLQTVATSELPLLFWNPHFTEFCNFQEAQQYTESFPCIFGHKWRLPSLQELQALHAQRIYLEMGPEEEIGWVWTSDSTTLLNLRTGETTLHNPATLFPRACYVLGRVRAAQVGQQAFSRPNLVYPQVPPPRRPVRPPSPSCCTIS